MMFFAGLTNYCLMEKILQRFGFQNTCSTMAGQAEMQVYDAKTHWEKVYQTKKSNEVSWYQEKPKTSLKLIDEIGLDKNSEIIDVGAGDSKLVDNLLDLGFKNITVLDISPTALNRAKKRLGNQMKSVKWVVSDFRNEAQPGHARDHTCLLFQMLLNQTQPISHSSSGSLIFSLLCLMQLGKCPILLYF